MAKNNLGVGVFKIENKKYGYRIAVKKPDGTRVDTTHHLDMNGQVMTSAHAASADRARRIAEIKNPESPQNQITDCKLSEMWEVYLKSNAPQKASSTVRKYESLWRIHVEPRFGNMKISKITTVDIEDFLTELYCSKNYSYKYVESFYKLFLQLYSLAFRDKHISRDTFFEMFEHKSTKITLPKIDQSDAEEYKKIETFTKGEIARIAGVLKGTNFYLPFLIGYTTGCRIGEVFGLMWEDYNMDTHVLTVQRQMVREDDEFVIKGVKTLQSVREIDVPKILHDELCAQRRFQNSQKTNYKNPNLPTAYQSKVESGYVIDKTGKQPKKLSAPNFICRKENGEFMTPHSVKYWAKEIQTREGIHFEFHKLRKTHLSYLAGMNVPAIELMKRAGHKKYDTSMKYYINRSEESKKYLLDTIDRISLTAPRYRIYFDPERKNPIEVSEEQAIRMLTQHSLVPKSYDDKSLSLLVELIDDGGGILPTEIPSNTAPQTAPGRSNIPDKTTDTQGRTTGTYGGYTPLTAEAIAEALRATGRGDTADAILEIIGADSK